MQVVHNAVVAVLAGVGLDPCHELRVAVFVLVCGRNQHYALEVELSLIPPGLELTEAVGGVCGQLPTVGAAFARGAEGFLLLEVLHCGGGGLDDDEIDIEVEEKRVSNDMLAASGMDQVMDNMNDMMKNIMPVKKKKRRVTVNEAREILAEEEAEKLIDEDLVNQEAIKLAENHGIVFIDEIDKIAESNGVSQGAGVSREGVQRDILPIVEGSIVKTK